MENISITTILAVYGAIISSSVLIFEIVKWTRTGKPKLRISAHGPMISAQPTTNPSEYFTVYVSNIGDAATTITALSFRYFENGPPNIKKDQPTKRGLFNYLSSDKFPKKLDVGDEWSDVLPLNPDLKGWARNGYLYIEVSDSFQSNAIKHARTRLVLDE